MIKITPKTQKERFLCSIAEGVDNAPSAVTREEKFFAEILKRPAQAPSPITRYEKYLAKIAGHDVDIPKPYTRLEYFLAKAAGMDIQTPIPITREEMYWSNYAPAPAPTAKTIEGVLPLVFSADGNNLTDYTIYGASGGVGDYNSTTGKYDIPVTISGKNIIVNTLASQTYNGITLTRNSDGSVTLNGTAEASMNFSMARDTHTLYSDDYQPIENAVYVISGSPQGAAVNKYMMSFRYVSAIGLTSSFTRVPTDGRTIDNTGGEFNYIAPYISVWSGITCNNVTFYPMLRKIGMGDEYEPPSTSTTVTLSVDSPLAAGQTLSLADTQIDLSTVNGTNEIVVGTTVKPSKVKLSGEVEFIREGEPTVYTISYYSQDGTTLLGTEYVEPEHNGQGYSGDTPTKASTEQYDYSFVGWSSETGATEPTTDVLKNITADKSVYAAFEAVEKTYDVKFYNADVLLYTDEGVEYGGTAAYSGSTPTKAETAQYTYTFIGWNSNSSASTADDNALTNVTADRDVYAIYTATEKTFEVNFYNGDTLLETVQNVQQGGTATYTGSTPTKSGYVFTGWSPSPTNIQADTACYAQFEQIPDYITDSWDTISNRGIAGTAQNYYSVGDCKPIELNGTMGTLTLDHETVYVYILGFNHNSTYEPNGITFGGFKTNPTPDGKDICLIDSHYSSNDTTGLKWFNMNHRRGSSEYGHNYGGWKGCDMRYDILGSTNVQPSGYGANATTSNVGYDATSTCATNPVANTLMSCLPVDLRTVMKPMIKYTDNVGNSSNVEANITTSIDYLPLLSEYEVHGSRTYANQYEQNKQARYAYYIAGNSSVKYEHSDTSPAAYWWVRSPNCSGNRNFCCVGTSGDATGNYSRYSRGVAPIFLVGTAPTTYTVTYYSQDGQTVLSTETVEEGHDCTYSTAPTKESDTDFNYTFTGWSTSTNQSLPTSGATTNIQQDTNLYAAFSKTFKTDTISDSWEDIITACNNGTYSSKYQVGDLKTIDVGTEGPVQMQIVAIDTDVLADSTNTAPITWVSKQLLNTDHRMNPAKQSGTSGTGTLGGWGACEMRSYLINTIKPLLPSEVRNALKTVKKYSKIYNTSETAVNNVVSNDDIWIPSAYEVNFTDYETSGVTYSTAFPDNASRIKHKVGGAAAWWWLRSAAGVAGFRVVGGGGSGGYGGAYDSGGVAVGFCV